MLQRVVRSTIIDAPIERVWAVLRDFNSHDQWHEAVESSRIEGGERSDQVGCVRSFTLRDGNRIREQLLTLDEREHKSTYCIVEATVPLQRYVATVTLKPVTDGNRTFWHWESTFATPPGMEARTAADGGRRRLRSRLRMPAPAPAQRRRPARPAQRADAPGLAAAEPARGAAPLWRARSTDGRKLRMPGAARGRGAHPPARHRRQLHRCLPAPRLDPADAAGVARVARRARHGGRRQRARRRRRASPMCCLATA